MVGEEIGINDHLAANGIEPIETDLGEYIIQLRNEPPSHIIAPSVHVTKDQVEETFRRVHTDLDPGRNLSEPSSLLHEARVKLRTRFLAADVGITGANTGWTGLVRESLAGSYVSQHVAILRPAGVMPEWLAYSIASDRCQRMLMESQYGGTKTQLASKSCANSSSVSRTLRCSAR